MLKELLQIWKESDFVQKIIAIIVLPFGIAAAIIYGLWLVFWNKYALVILCALILAQADDEPGESANRGQAAALLISVILLVIRAYRKNKNK